MINFIKICYNYFFIPVIKSYFFIKYLINPNFNRSKIIGNFYSNIFKNNYDKKRIWFHASSMGEFEQAKPVIELIKEKNPDTVIICSFFSPSGYENQKNYMYADYITYLPVDSKYDALEFINKIRVDAAVFVRYDLWINYLTVLNQRKIPVMLINATIPGVFGSRYFKFLRTYYLNAYSLFSEIFAFNQQSYDFFRNEMNCTDVILSSDTRLDRIAKIVQDSSKDNILPDLLVKDFKILVVGSSWEADEILVSQMINHFNRTESNDFNKTLKVIFVPHVPTENNLLRIEKLVPNTIRFSQMKNMMNHESIKDNHIIIDSIGLLVKLYKYADFAYVGCGFGDGVHSTAEPAGYGIPIATGPNIQKSPDAVQLFQSGALTIIKNSDELTMWIEKYITCNTGETEAGLAAHNYVFSNIGSTLQIYESIKEKLIKS